MSEASELLRTILDQPDADAPRLAYADWLAQQPNHAAQDRARFIRLQIEIEQLRHTDRRWPDLVRQERELLATYRTAWERPFRSLLKPSIFEPISWIRASLFGSGGTWHFHRGFIEEIASSAAQFLTQDIGLFEHTPIRSVVLTHASKHVGTLARESRLERLHTLYFVSDVEFDEDLDGLIDGARAAGLKVLEVRFPRLETDADELFSVLREVPEDEAATSEKLEAFPNWTRASARERERLRYLATVPRFLQHLTEQSSPAEVLRVNSWIYLGDQLREAGAWAVAKSYHDLEDEQGNCRRIILFKPERMRQASYQALRASPHFCTEHA